MKKIIFGLTVSLTLTVAHGQTGWQYQNSNLTTNQFGHGAIYPINKDTVYVIADTGKFLKTYNGGTNWVSQNTGFTVFFFDLSFYNTDTGYAVGQNGTIIKTIDGGTNWTTLTSGTNKDLFSISAKVANNLWAVGDSGVILNSNNYGTTWIKNDTLTNNKLNSICFRNSNIGFIAGNNGTLFETVNGGTNWDTLAIATTKDLFSLTVTGNYAYLLAGWVMNYFFDSDELFKTNDNINWMNSNLLQSFPGSNAKLYFQNDSLGYTIGSNCTTNSDCGIIINKTTDFGQNWVNSFINVVYQMPIGEYSDIVFATDSIGYALSGNKVLKTTDGGIFVAVKDLNDNSHLKVFPNPFSTQTVLRTDNLLHNATLTVDNCFGQTVAQIKNINGQTVTLHRDNLASGLYFVRLTEENKTIAVDKLVITDK